MQNETIRISLDSKKNNRGVNGRRTRETNMKSSILLVKNLDILEKKIQKKENMKNNDKKTIRILSPNHREYLIRIESNDILIFMIFITLCYNVFAVLKMQYMKNKLPAFTFFVTIKI